MKHSRAFILVELLTGMALQAGFILVLCTSFYLMLSFYTRTQQVLTAKQKGEKVIAYVDARIRNAGLGLSKCGSSYEVRDALCKVTNLTGMKPKLTLPVAITSGDGSNVGDNKTSLETSGDKIIGNILTLLYTQRPLDKNFTIATKESPDESGYNIPIEVSQDAQDVRFITGSDGQQNYKDSDFISNISHRERYLSSYTAMAGAGRPLCIDTQPDDGGHFKLSLQTESSSEPSVKVYPGDELLYLKCERMFVKGQNFSFRKFAGSGWASDTYPNEEGILEVYFELDKNKNILDMYVLASGGANDSGNTQKPAAWPLNFWKAEYEKHTIYVSRASWKLSNVNFSGSNWN